MHRPKLWSHGKVFQIALKGKRKWGILLQGITLLSGLLLADCVPVYKKISKDSKDNYRPVTILRNISKVYEICIYDQIPTCFSKILSKYQYVIIIIRLQFATLPNCLD